MRKLKDNLFLTGIWASILLTVSFLFLIIGYVVYNGFSSIDLKFLTSGTDPVSVYGYFEEGENYDFNYEIITEEDKTIIEIVEVNEIGSLKDNDGQKIALSKGTEITKVESSAVDSMSVDEAKSAVESLKNPNKTIKVKLTVPGGGILPLILSTLYIIALSILISVPIGVFAAIYLVEYKISSRADQIIHFAIDSLASIPSIIFGLFGSVLFVVIMGFGISILSGILTVSIMLLPIVIKTVEESLKAVPESYKEASYGLGATKSQTIFKIIIPSALPGIVVAIILAMSRVIGESAIFIFTAGTTAQMPSLMQGAATLTVHAYGVTREVNDIATASAIGIVIIVIVLALNLLAKYIQKRFYIGGNK